VKTKLLTIKNLKKILTQLILTKKLKIYLINNFYLFLELDFIDTSKYEA
jgi:hypothetical protein